MDWITENVAIGNHIDAHDSTLRAGHGFISVISVDGSITKEKALNLGYGDWICTSLIDGHGNDVVAFRKLVQDLIDMVEGSLPVLVRCHAGWSRSVTVVALLAIRLHPDNTTNLRGGRRACR